MGDSEKEEEGRKRRRSLPEDRTAQAKLSQVPILVDSGPASFPPTAQCLSGCYQLHLTDGETEVQRGTGTYPYSSTVMEALSGLQLRSSISLSS